ncbi:aspartyl beta-hydroxylase [Caulobacter soli]|uniref:aspartyl beta-hydroxylase n=1 Tax=Caulobacter soli TaxID=2708539 RepID=UPI0013EE0AF7|nr:aspartyl beta-hydroxylase [Caulobacter soli]
MTAGLQALRERVLDDPVAQETLDAIEDFEAFAARAADLASARGLNIDAADIRAAVHDAFAPPITRATAPQGWLPAKVTSHDGHPAVTWLRFGRWRLTQPFYDDDLMRARLRPLNRLIGLRTPLPRPGDHPARDPDGLIFHMSRCGSTLAAQMLAASSANLVISEAPPIDAVLALDVGDDAKVESLRAMVAALGQARAGETRLFLKLDCWHVRDLPLLRRAFPAAPWIFLYREPIEVLVSHARRRGVQMIPDFVSPERLGLALPGGVPDLDYCARVLAAICEGAARHHPGGGGRLVNYRDLPRALFITLLPHFGVAPSEGEAALMRTAGARDAKTPEQGFIPDGEAKRREAGEDLRAICEHRVGDVYRRLEALRMAQT